VRKRIVVVALAVLFVVLAFLSSCTQPGGSTTTTAPASNPFVGTWSLSGIATYTFAADKTCSISGSLVTALSGTYSYTDKQINISWSDGTSTSALYVINGNTMTWTPVSGSGLPVTLTKQ